MVKRAGQEIRPGETQQPGMDGNFKQRFDLGLEVNPARGVRDKTCQGLQNSHTTSTACDFLKVTFLRFFFVFCFFLLSPSNSIRPRGTFYYYHPDSGARQWEPT